MNFFKPHIFTRLDLLKLIPKRGSVLEVGVFDAVFTAQMCQARPDLKIVGVDSWEGQFKLNRDMAMSVNEGKALLITAKSVDFAAQVANYSFDMVYIDGAHDYKSVKADLEAWYPKVKNGGIFAGHDYMTILEDRPIWGPIGVEKAVNEFVEAGKFKLNVISGEYPPSWWMRK